MADISADTSQDRERLTMAPLTPEERSRRLHDLDRLADALDSRFRIPGTKIRFGYDSLIGFIPGIGDAASVLPAGWIIYQGHRLGAPKRTLARMATNVAIDSVVGSIPLLGDLFDVGFKANRRNIGILKAALDRQEARSRAF